MKRQNTSENRAKRHTELKRKSLQKPGVRQILEVYSRWEIAHQAIQAHQDLKNVWYKSVNSNSSDPNPFFKESYKMPSRSEILKKLQKTRVQSFDFVQSQYLHLGYSRKDCPQN